MICNICGFRKIRGCTACAGYCGECNPRKALDNLADALVEDIMALSDEEILAEFREDHGDPEWHIAEMRAILEEAIAIARERRAALL